MLRQILLNRCLAIIVAAAATGLTSPVRSAEVDPFNHGKHLFEKNWVPNTGEDGSKNDGLGPLFNDTSCINCHHQGGAGGGGPARDNVHVLTVESLNFRVGSSRAADPKVVARGVEAIRQIHPALIDKDGGLQPILILHRNATGDDGQYSLFRESLLAEIDAQIGERQIPSTADAIARAALPRLEIERSVDIGGSLAPLKITFRIGQRNTPALYGAGLIDRISDGYLKSAEIGQEKNDEISGRVAQTNGWKSPAGKFGWRGQVSSLRSFVERACAVEMGLQAPLADQPMNPTQQDYVPAGLDVTKEDVSSLTKFVSMMPVPVIDMPETHLGQEIARRGYAAFNEVGCGVCHKRKMATVNNLFSDLLLHDMGDALEDYAPATIDIQNERVVKLTRSTPRPSSPGGLRLSQSAGTYYGSPDAFTFGDEVYPPKLAFIPKRLGKGISNRQQIMRQQNPTRIRNEWRTPPLWGLRDSAPYLHDGRAATVLEAIMLHGGESAQTIRRFSELSLADQQAVLAFLDTLAAPPMSAEALASK